MRVRTMLCVLGALLGSSCSGIYRVPDIDVTKLRAGQSIEEVREIIGRPWQLISNPLDPSRETHRYVQRREVVDKGYLDDDGRRTGVVTQYRVLELTYVDGKLVGPRAVATSGIAK